MARYLVTHATRNGGRQGIGVFKTKAAARAAIKKALRSKAFKKLGYSNPRISKQE